MYKQNRKVPNILAKMFNFGKGVFFAIEPHFKVFNLYINEKTPASALPAGVYYIIVLMNKYRYNI